MGRFDQTERLRQFATVTMFGDGQSSLQLRTKYVGDSRSHSHAGLSDAEEENSIEVSQIVSNASYLESLPRFAKVPAHGISGVSGFESSFQNQTGIPAQSFLVGSHRLKDRKVQYTTCDLLD